MEIPVNTVLNVSQNEIELAVHGYQGCREDCWGPGQIQKVEPLLCESSRGVPQEILHALKCVLGASEAPFHTCIQYIHNCQLQFLFSGFRSKSMMYRAVVQSKKAG